MGNAPKVDSKEVGLEIGLLLGKYFLKTEDLHYGFWPVGETADISNFAEAQENHSAFILDNIPPNTKTILDVGAGAGNFAQKLIDRGYQVDCVIPSKFLTEKLRTKLGDQSIVYPVIYENMTTDKRYDLILFSESFAYVNIKTAFEQTSKFLNPDGKLLICDFFSLQTQEKSPIIGGHKFHRFNEELSKSSFKKVLDIDITRETAPTYTVLTDFIELVAEPVTKISSRYLFSNYPRLMKFLTWKFRKRLNKLQRKYLTGKLTADSFEKFKTYRLFLFGKKQPE